MCLSDEIKRLHMVEDRINGKSRTRSQFNTMDLMFKANLMTKSQKKMEYEAVLNAKVIKDGI